MAEEEATRQSSLNNSLSKLSVSHIKNEEDTLQHAVVEALVKLAVLDYRMEPRFRQPLMQRAQSAGTTSFSTSGSSPVSSAASPVSADSSLSHSEKRHSRFNKLLHSSDYKLSNDTIPKLKEQLNVIAMKKGADKSADLDDLTRRSLLGYYTELLDPSTSSSHIKQPEQLVVRFVACATKEINKVGNVPRDQLSNVIYKQTEYFISILIKIVRPEKHSDIMIGKLDELKKSMRPSTYTTWQQQQKQLATQTQNQNAADLKYLKPSFKITDMVLAQYVGTIFGIDKLQMQSSVTGVRESAKEQVLTEELQSLLREYEEHSDSVKYQLEDFEKTKYYLNWKSGEERALRSLIEKYQPLKKQNKSVTSAEAIIPQDVRSFFIETAKACLKHDREMGSLLSNSSQELLELCCKIWRIDNFSKTTWIYTALNESVLSEAINEEELTDFYKLFKSYDLDQHSWPKPVQAEWEDNLSFTYVQVMKEIRDNLTRIYSDNRPKFGPILNVLGDLEADPLFPGVSQSGLPKKWERKLSKSLLKISEARYVDLLKQVPTDKSLTLYHVSEIANKVIDDARLLTKRYPNPLLGFLYVPQICAGLSTAMLAADSKNMLLHIKSYSNNELNYGDAMEVYKTLCEIRSIFSQVSPASKVFQFDLENFFYPYVSEWCEESGAAILKFFERAVEHDTFEPVDPENDKLYSSSIIDMFAMVNQSLNVLKALSWQNEYDYAKFVTKLLKFISTGMIDYSNKIMELMLHDLDEQTDDITEDQGLLNNTTEWFKNAVSTNASKVPPPKPFDFKARTCVALNNLEALLINLQKLEESIDPESISSAIKSKESKVQYSSHLFSIRIIKSENLKKFTTSSRLPDTYVSLVDGQNKRRIAKTRIVKNNLNPEWDEEFEFVIQSGASAILGATVWDCSSRLGQQNVCGRTVVSLQPKRFSMDGLPQEFELDLDTQGKLIMQISMESEREDAVFSIGRAHRSITRVQERCVKLIVEKFLTFIEFSISRNTLKLVCGHNGQVRPPADLAKSALEPLFDYLNSNFQVLASNLTDDLLLKVILQTWIIVLNTADNLLTPKLSTAKSTITINALKSHNKRLSTASWQTAVTKAVVNVTGAYSIPGFGKPLTAQEVEVLFEWLKVLCYEFFYNNGAGPPIEELKNEHYQELLLVPVYYDHDVAHLKAEVERFSPATLKLIREKHFYSIGSEKAKDKKLTRAGTIARKNTIMASGSAKQRELASKEYKQARADPIAAQASAENLVLKLLLLKGENEFVISRLEQRERLSKSISAEFFARLAAEGNL